MAKRKRLAPAQPRDLDAAPLETKSALGFSAPPIASVAGDAAAQAALEEVTETLRRARAEGRMITDIALDQIDEGYLVRDRIIADDEEMEALQSSLKARGQQTPIEVVELGADRYGLISGWRRCQALKAIGASTARAIITQPVDAPDAYVAMIEENEIRVGLSYFERARIVVKAVEAGAFTDEKQALQRLFASASRAKRSKIKSFIPVASALGGALKFPTLMGERMGLKLSKALSDDPHAPRRILSALAARQASTFEQEQAVLDEALKQGLETADAPMNAARSKPKMVKHTIHPGIILGTDGKTIVIEGRRVTPALHNALRMWLINRG